MATIATAKRRYAAKVPAMGANFQASMERFLGVGSGRLSSSTPVVNYRDAIKSGVEDKWERNLRAAFGV